MKIELKEISIREICNGFVDDAEEGVVAYGGKLNIRPKYQREFFYKGKQRDLVIDTVKKGFPLNVMYWAKTDDGNFEVLDGQQRTMSICQYKDNVFSINDRYFNNLTETEKNQILDYKLMIYICDGTDKEKLEWFQIINIAGAKLSDQELLNAIYTGEWLSSAKRYFSKKNCPAHLISGKYVDGTVERQELLEKALKWISNNNIASYMAKHQQDTNANELWFYYNNVITWARTLFPEERTELKQVDWGFLYNTFKDVSFDAKELEFEIEKLMEDDDVTKKAGIYPYLLTGEEKYLNIRNFTQSMKKTVYHRQKGICPHCGEHFEFGEMEGDHITPWHLGGKTNIENCQMLCRSCNRKKGGS